ncbi:hypothetical protein [Variovorax saccharolyticus]|uniref:hypothetical protein n=1 Tax=Variovorax saccharolyticus TaxID=3053516 RepID=UPI002574D39C|nr:hypothetical protein [Variovorax sp. J31P216]MDM0029111.1 hypothetical protein [Variovorax sp. J31P216]
MIIDGSEEIPARHDAAACRSPSLSSFLNPSPRRIEIPKGDERVDDTREDINLNLNT